MVANTLAYYWSGFSLLSCFFLGGGQINSRFYVTNFYLKPTKTAPPCRSPFTHTNTLAYSGHCRFEIFLKIILLRDLNLVCQSLYEEQEVFYIMTPVGVSQPYIFILAGAQPVGKLWLGVSVHLLRQGPVEIVQEVGVQLLILPTTLENVFFLRR
jgi:hypothetical protein